KQRVLRSRVHSLFDLEFRSGTPSIPFGSTRTFPLFVPNVSKTVYWSSRSTRHAPIRLGHPRSYDQDRFARIRRHADYLGECLVPRCDGSVLDSSKVRDRRPEKVIALSLLPNSRDVARHERQVVRWITSSPRRAWNEQFLRPDRRTRRGRRR